MRISSVILLLAALGGPSATTTSSLLVQAFAPLSTTTTTTTTSTRAKKYYHNYPVTTAQHLFKWSSSSSSEDSKTDLLKTSSALNKKTKNNEELLETKGMPDLIAFLQSANPNNNKEQNEVSTSSTSSKLTTRRQTSKFTMDDDQEGLSAFDGTMAESMSFTTVFSIVAIVGSIILATAATYLGLGIDDIVHTASSFVQNPQQTMNDVIQDIQNIGPAAPFFYGLLYCIAEILAVPATPLTLSAGYLFGLSQGVLVVLVAGTVAACVGFAIGKTALRGAVENLLEENPEFRKLDKAIGKEGFKLLVLVRLTPIFPFSLSNYIYGASAIQFWPYFWGTLLGFTPGTIAYVYSGMVGQALLSGEGNQPWYYYAAGVGILGAVLKYITDTATSIVKTMEEDMD
jgi:uncharacterized membrane protein YdjX (TVP38/TMEM64 family)